MFSGAMLMQSVGLSQEEGRAIARYITGKAFRTESEPMGGQCTAPAKKFSISGTAWNGWGVEPGN